MSRTLAVRAMGKTVAAAELRAVEKAREIVGGESVYLTVTDDPRNEAWRLVSTNAGQSSYPGENVHVDCTFEWALGDWNQPVPGAPIE